MKTRRLWLVVDASGSIGVRTRRPNSLGIDQFSVPVVLNIPDAWGTVLEGQEITINMPEPPVVTAEVDVT